MDLLFHAVVGAAIGECAPKRIQHRQLKGVAGALLPDLANLPSYLYLGMKPTQRCGTPRPRRSTTTNGSSTTQRGPCGTCPTACCFGPSSSCRCSDMPSGNTCSPSPTSRTFCSTCPRTRGFGAWRRSGRTPCWSTGGLTRGRGGPVPSSRTP